MRWKNGPRLLRRADTRVGAHRVLLGFLAEGQLLLALAPLRQLDDRDEGGERLLEVAQVEVDPALFVLGESVDGRVGELEDLVIELERVLELLLLEVILAEREERVRDVLRLGEVLDQPLEQRARQVFALLLREQIRQVEEHLVHALVLLEPGVVGDEEVGLDRRLQQSFSRFSKSACLRLEAGDRAGVALLLRVIDLLIDLAGAEVVVVLLLGVEFGHAEQEVRLVRILVVVTSTRRCSV